MIWKNIESAPLDGSVILLGYLDKRGKFAVRSGYWMDDLYPNSRYPKEKIGGWVCSMDPHLLDQRATHWCKLENIPEVEK